MLLLWVEGNKNNNKKKNTRYSKYKKIQSPAALYKPLSMLNINSNCNYWNNPLKKHQWMKQAEKQSV